MITLFFPAKCFGVVQFNLMLIAVAGLFYNGAHTFLNGANVSQTCEVLTNAFNSNKTEYQNYVFAWVTNSTDYNSASTNLTKNSPIQSH